MLGCVTCAQNNAGQRSRPKPGVQTTGTTSIKDLEVDFTEALQELLILACVGLHYAKWVEAFLMHTGQAQEVARALLRKIVPRYELPSL